MKLEDIKTTDFGGIPPHTWWQRRICRIIGAKTFHWLKFVAPVEGDWIVSESIGKGPALTLFGNRRALVYRAKELAYEPTPMHLVKIHAKYGDYPYDWEVSFRTAIWWLAKHYLGKVVRVVKDKAVNCQEWVVLIAGELGVKIIPDGEYPMSVNLENSSYLEYIGEVAG
jgi:hypothetical protein